MSARVVPIRPKAAAGVMNGRRTFHLIRRGPVYHTGEPNRCPGCDRQNWWVGRVTAECAFCGTALPLG